MIISTKIVDDHVFDGGGAADFAFSVSLDISGGRLMPLPRLPFIAYSSVQCPFLVISEEGAASSSTAMHCRVVTTMVM